MVVLPEGDVLYIPAGQVHMAWSTANNHSLHATVGIGRTNQGFTWAGIISH